MTMVLCCFPLLACSGVPQVIQASDGTIASPNYPENYVSRLNCAWRITVPDGFRVQLRFEGFALESQSICNFDSVELRNGFTNTSPLIGKYCGSTTPPAATSQGRNLYIKFKTDGSGTRKGFKARFIAVSGPTAEPSGKK